MKLIPVTYYGFTAMDRRFSTPMLPWVVAEIRKRNYSDRLSVGIEDGVLQAYNQDFELQFTHKIWQITRFSKVDYDQLSFLYLMRDDSDTLLYCYLFQAKLSSDVSDLYKQMKDQNHYQPPTRSVSSAANLTSLCVDISPSSSNFFEVLYIGKIKVWQKKVPDSFIDDALDKFKVHEMEKHKRKMLGNIGRLKSESNIRRGSNDSTNSMGDDVIGGGGVRPSPPPQLQRSVSSITNLTVNRAVAEQQQQLLMMQRATSEQDDISLLAASAATASQCSDNDSNFSNSNNSLKIDIDDHNRTMVLQVDRTDLRLISPDRKVILLHKHHKDVSTCIQGITKAEHFGFICRDLQQKTTLAQQQQTFIGYIFKCESASIATDAVSAITQAFLSAEARPKAALSSCDHCPMVWFHRLCTEIEHLSDRKTQSAIIRRVEQMDDDEQNTIMTKFRGAETDSIREQNEFLMMLLRAHCEMKQNRHVHDTAENRSEFLNQYLGGGTIFMKAKRSLTNSFEMLKRKASKDDFGSTLKEMNLQLNRDISSPHSPNSDVSDKDSDCSGMRSRSSTIGSQNDLQQHILNNKSSVSPDRCSNISTTTTTTTQPTTITSTADTNNKGLKSPMIDIFLKVGSSPKSSSSHHLHVDDNGSPKLDAAGSWRQAIFKRVVTPNKQLNEMVINENDSNAPTQMMRQRTREELRELWKKSICQAILLVRMEKENARIKAQQEESAVKRIKLEYDEMKPNQREVMEVWEMVTSKDPRMKCDNQMLLHAIRQGVPRGKRGEVWQFLTEQYCMKVAPIDTTKFPNYNIPYEQLLKQLTSHQHAILIDLGRTFPNHSYFSSPLGPGQLALFNLLKAYSLLDSEMGYCQGLSFVAGVLLLHMEESQAFFLLRHLMFRRGLRKQYLPDMVGLQVKLYQLSRLLHDQLPDLYEHFDLYEISPTLYAAPWLLTMFASQFPLGFVTRVYDLIFLESPDVIFRVAIALLAYHKEKLLICDSFEEIMDYLKTNLPNIDKPTLDKVMKQVFSTDITRQLNEYQVEYQVLQEEMTSVQPQVDALHKIEHENKRLNEQNKSLMSQLELALSNVQRLEKTRTLQQSQLNRLEMNSRSLNVTIATLGNFINTLIDDKIDIEISDDVRRILSQFNHVASTNNNNNNTNKQNNNDNNVLKKNNNNNKEKLMMKSLSTGKISLPNSLLLLSDQDNNLMSSRSTSLSNTTNVGEIKSMNLSTSPKTSQFFSTSHNNIILQQKLFNNNNTSNPKIDITIQDIDLLSSSSSGNNNINNNRVSPTESIDSGVDTPSSPGHHPLSDLI